MNRGNLAEDPKAGLSSSSRYSHMGREKNSLLYVDSSSIRREKKAAERKNGKKGKNIKGDQKSIRKRSVGHAIPNSHMDRLEVGSDGRLFHVKESIPPIPSETRAYTSGSTSNTESAPNKQRDITSGAAPIRPAFSVDVLSETSGVNAQATAKAVGVNAQATAKAVGMNAQATAEAVGVNPHIYTGAAGVRLIRDNGHAVPYSNPLISSVPRVSLIRRLRAPLIAAGLAVLTAGYIYTGWHYRNRFYPGTEFFGINAAEQSVYDVKAAIKTKVDSYQLKVIARQPDTNPANPNLVSTENGNLITAEDVGMAYHDNGEIDQAMKDQKSWAWPIMMFMNKLDKGQTVLQTSYDENKIAEAVSSLDCMQEQNMIQPQDATIIMTDNGAEVQPEIYGTTLSPSKTEEAVKEALDNGSTVINLDNLGLYKNPKVYSGDISLMTEAMALNKVLGAKIILRFGDQNEVINSKTIRGFLIKENGEYVLSEERVRNYVTRLAEKYDTYQKKREFYTSLGTNITLEEGIGDYGWEMDQDSTYNEILSAIYDQKKVTIDPIYFHEGYCQGANDIGDTYVEISITNQMMWFYKNGTLVVKTPVVTGNPYAGHDTPSGGIWSLKGRARNQCLVGQGYSSPVDYWMPFNKGVGIHDMQSRGWFGGSIYLGSGSHGCVNTPLAAVKLIYDQIEEGVPVIVYKDESDEAYAQWTDAVDVQTVNATIEENYGTVEDDGIGSIVSWTRAAQAQAAQAQAAQAAANAASGTSTQSTTTATGGSTVTAS